MAKVKIMADSTCDLSKDLVQEFDITIIPLHIMLGNKDYEDGRGIVPGDIIKWSDEKKMTPKTAAPGTDTIEEIFAPYKDDDTEIICFTISEEMSTTANVVRLMSQTMDMEERVHVVDSRNLSTGIGLLVLEACDMASLGMSANVIVDQINELIPKVRASFVVDTLTYLHRGGRCSAVAAIAGTVLGLHPEIVVRDGKMGVGRKYRGRMDKVTLDYAKALEKELLNAKPGRVFITHSPTDETIIREVRRYLESLGYFDRILETEAGGVVTSHCGPGTLGVLFISAE